MKSYSVFLNFRKTEQTKRWMDLRGKSFLIRQVRLLKSKLRSLVPSSSNVNQENIYRLENVSQPGTVDKKLHTPGSFDIGAMNVEAKPIRPRAQEPSPKSVMSSGRKSPATGAIIARQLTHIHDKPRKKILSRDDDSNFFGTPSPSPLLAP